MQVHCGGDTAVVVIAALEPDHPTRRFVSMLCIYSAEIDPRATGDLDVGFSAGEADRFARGELMPDDLFEALACRADHELAEDIIVPVEQIAEKRRDLAEPRMVQRNRTSLSRWPARATPASAASADRALAAAARVSAWVSTPRSSFAHAVSITSLGSARLPPGGGPPRVTAIPQQRRPRGRETTGLLL